MSDSDDEEMHNDFHLPDDVSEWTAKLEANSDVEKIRLFVDEMADQELLDRCTELGKKLEKLASILICPYNDSCPIINVAGQIMNIRKDSLQELRLWLSEPVRGTKEDYAFFYQRITAAKSLKEFDLHNPYEWEIEDGAMAETEKVPWILKSVLGPLNQLPSLQDVAFSSFPLTQTKETETSLLGLCQSKEGKPNLSLDIYDCELTSTFLSEVCGTTSRVAKLILTAISNINDSGIEFSNSLKRNQILKSLVVRRMPGSKFTSCDLTARTASTLASALKDIAVLESLEISVKSDMDSPDTRQFLESVHGLEQVKNLTIQFNAKTYDQVLRATLALIDGIGKNKALTKLAVKARINKEGGEETEKPPAEECQQKHAEELGTRIKAAIDQHSALLEIDLEGVLFARLI